MLFNTPRCIGHPPANTTKNYLAKNINSAEVLFCFVIIITIIFWPCCMACGILVPRPGIEPGPDSESFES